MEAVLPGEVTLATGRRTQTRRSVSRYKSVFSLLVGCAFLTLAPQCGTAAEPPGWQSEPYFPVRLSDGVMWVPCGFEVRMQSEPIPILEINSGSTARKVKDILSVDRFQALIRVGGADMLEQLGITASALGQFGTPVVKRIGRVTLTTWPKPYGPFTPNRYLSFLTHGSAGVMVIAANRDFATLLAESIDYKDQPIVLE